MPFHFYIVMITPMAYFKKWDSIFAKICSRTYPPCNEKSRLLTLGDSQHPSYELLMSMTTPASLTYKNYSTTSQSMPFSAIFYPFTLDQRFQNQTQAHKFKKPSAGRASEASNGLWNLWQCSTKIHFSTCQT